MLDLLQPHTHSEDGCEQIERSSASEPLPLHSMLLDRITCLSAASLPSTPLHHHLSSSIITTTMLRSVARLALRRGAYLSNDLRFTRRSISVSLSPASSSLRQQLSIQWHEQQQPSNVPCVLPRASTLTHTRL